MQRFIKSLVLIAALFICSQLHAADRKLNKEDYIFPLRNVAGYYSSNFGELRPDHFHSGVDIKTNGVEGKEVLAVADGYICRIAKSAYGFGLALYVAHPNGTTSVYAHLSRFTKEVEKYVEAERYRQCQHAVNLFCTPTQFPVSQGDVIAWSGNSGSSAGPHLHFELRDSRDQRTLNPLYNDIFRPKDTIAPKIFKVHYIEVDSVGGAPVDAPLASYEAVAVNSNTYKLVSTNPIPVGRKGYFVLEGSDRKNDVTNVFGLARVRGYLDDNEYFDYLMDGFTFDKTRYCNAISYYPLKIYSRNEFVRLAMVENGIKDHYNTLVDRGLVCTTASQHRSVKIVVDDDCSNTSTLNFDIVGKSDAACFKAKVDTTKRWIMSSKDFSASYGDLSISVPAGALYESIQFNPKEITQQPKVKAYSKIYKVFDYTTPLHSYVRVSLKADLPPELRDKCGLAVVTRTGGVTFIGGTYNNGVISGNTRYVGSYFVAVDTTPPSVKPTFANGANLTHVSSLKFSLSDNFSGTRSYTATIDGKWITLDLLHGVATHTFATAPNGGTHTLKITAVDGVGNTTIVTRTFIR